MMSRCQPKPDIPVVVRGWSLWVPPPLGRDGKPRWINANERNHWGGRSGKTKVWREQARMVAEEAAIPVLVLAWVFAVFHFGNARRRDVSNYHPTVKACVDGFTDAGLWADDNDTVLVGPDLRRAPADFVRTKLGDAKAKGIEFRIFEVADGN